MRRGSGGLVFCFCFPRGSGTRSPIKMHYALGILLCLPGIGMYAPVEERVIIDSCLQYGTYECVFLVSVLYKAFSFVSCFFCRRARFFGYRVYW